jgi:membrane associated rhomboid family serine protease
MNFLDKLERRFGNWAIPQFALFIVLANALIYVLSQIRPDFVYQLTLDPEAIRQGREYWRIVTFLFVPPPLGLLWMMLWLFVFYQFAQALEQEWGEFRFCLFYVIGALATIIAALCMGETLSNLPLNTTVFLAFATLFPNLELLLFFIIPIKVKYLAIFTWVGLLWSFIVGNMVTRVAILASLVNYLMFFGPGLWQTLLLKIEVYKNRRRFRG